MNLMRPKKCKGKKLGGKGVTMFILTVFIGSSVQAAGMNALPKSAMGPAPQHELQ